MAKSNTNVTIELTPADKEALTNAIHTQVKSLERAARAQQQQNRTAMAEIYQSEANALLIIKSKLL